LKKSCFRDMMGRDNETNSSVFLFIPTKYYKRHNHQFSSFKSGLTTNTDLQEVINSGGLDYEL